eukprot:1224324-Pleurochrysis_carterae.AAC.1
MEEGERASEYIHESRCARARAFERARVWARTADVRAPVYACARAAFSADAPCLHAFVRAWMRVVECV